MFNRQEVLDWIDFDPDNEDRELIRKWLEENNIEELEKSFQGLLEFGTAGLRGPIRPGPSGMNTAVVCKAAGGLVSYCKERNLRKIIIGRDARHGSEKFAIKSAEIFSGAGFEVFLLPRPLPTPVLAFAVNHLKMDVGVMVTASHNPAADNGYKVYLGPEVDGINYRGSQIISPTDGFIAEKIKLVNQMPLLGNNWSVLDESIIENYLIKTNSLIPNGSDLKIAYTAMHGVGAQTTEQLFNKSGFNNLVQVLEQEKPNPDFPTVAFPNPEEAGAMDLALELAQKEQVDIIIANDPDADRVALGFKNKLNQYQILKGDEVGILIGYFLATRMRNKMAGKAFANSIVSSSALSKIAEKFNIEFEETLTGFKYLAKIQNLGFGYEEALGYAVDPINVNDKDGISAALLLAYIVSELKKESLDVSDYLNEIWDQIGYHFTSSISLRFSQIDLIKKTMDELRTNPPIKVGEYLVSEIEDLSKPKNNLPATNGLRLFLKSGENNRAARIIIRPSGTEPKLKIYLEIVRPSAAQKEVQIAAQMAVELATELKKLAS